MEKYQEFISAFEMLMSDEILTLDETIQILRAENPLPETEYRPITDWYYCKEVMDDMFCSSHALDEADLLEIKENQKKYLSVSRSLTEITVEDCLAEMREKDKTA